MVAGLATLSAGRLDLVRTTQPVTATTKEAVAILAVVPKCRDFIVGGCLLVSWVDQRTRIFRS